MTPHPMASRLGMLTRDSRMQVIGQADQEAVESGGVDLSDGSREFGRVGGVEVAQPDDGRAMKTARREVRVARLDQLIPIGHLLVSLGTDPTNQMGLIRTGK
jgi:hypothetical protein